MSESKHRISLRIRHPSIDPDFVISKLGLKAGSAWKAGDQRTSPRGKHIGTADQTFCTFPLSTGTDVELAEALRVVVNEISRHRDFFRELKTSGGRIELYVGWFVGRHAGDVFEALLLHDIGDLGIDLALECYGPNQKIFDPVVLDFKQSS